MWQVHKEDSDDIPCGHDLGDSRQLIDRPLWLEEESKYEYGKYRADTRKRDQAETVV